MTARQLVCFVTTAILIGGCQGDVGTIGVTIVTAPGSEIMDTVQSARLTLSDPLTVVEAERDGNGVLVLDLEVLADGRNGFVRFDGFDTSGDLVALGVTPALPIAAIDAEIKIFVAAPGSLTEAPVQLQQPLAQMGVGVMGFGVLYAGGADANGDASTDVQIYNAYDHSFQLGKPLPSARKQPSVAVGGNGQVFIFGGGDDDDSAKSTLWRFDTNALDGGAYFEMINSAQHAHIGAATALVGGDAFLVASDPPLVIDFAGGGLFEYEPASDVSFSGATAATILFGGSLFTLVAGSEVGSTGSVLISDNILVELPQSPAELARDGHACVVLPDGDFLVIGGANPVTGALASAVRFDAIAREFTVISAMLDTPRTGAAIARSGLFVIVAGGLDDLGDMVSTMEIFDSSTLARVGIVPMIVPRHGATAAALPNGQVIIAGGIDASGDPIDTVELFTPDLR